MFPHLAVMVSKPEGSESVREKCIHKAFASKWHYSGVLVFCQRHRQSGNEASPCHAELVKMVTSKNLVGGLS